MAPGAASSPKKRLACGTRRIAVASQFGLEIVPPTPLPFAKVRENTTEPKFVSSRLRQPSAPQAAGASAIHSADVTSGAVIGRCFVNDRRRVRFLIWTRTSSPSTTTLAVIRSPGLIGRLMFTELAGTSSYQA